MAGVTEVSGAEAEEDGDGAAISALVLQVVSPVLGTHLGLADVTAASTHQLLRVVGVGGPGLQVTPGLASEVSLAALETDVVGVSVHGKPCNESEVRSPVSPSVSRLTCGIIEPPGALAGHSLALGQPLVLQPHQGLLPHVLVQGDHRLQQTLQGRVGDLDLERNVDLQINYLVLNTNLTNRTLDKSE